MIAWLDSCLAGHMLAGYHLAGQAAGRRRGSCRQQACKGCDRHLVMSIFLVLISLVWSLNSAWCVRLGRHNTRRIAGGSGLIDARGFLKDCYPVIDYEDDEDDSLKESSKQIEKEESQKKSGGEQCGVVTHQDDEQKMTTELVTGVTKCYMRARQVPGDGSCLFHALSAGLWLGINGTHHPMERKLLRCQSYFLRQTAVDVLQNSRDPMLYMGEGEKLPASQLLQLAAEQQSQTPEEYCAKVREPHAWGGGPEIVALANALRRPIHVYELVWGIPLGPFELTSKIVHDDVKEITSKKNVHDDVKKSLPRVRKKISLQPGLQEEADKEPRWCLRCIAEFGSPRFDRKHAPLHILSCDSRFPNLRPEHMLDQGNHFLMLFDCAPAAARQAALDAGFGYKAAETLASEARRRHDRRQADILSSKRKIKDIEQSLDRFVADLNVDTNFVQEERTGLVSPVIKRVGGPLIFSLLLAFLLKPLYDVAFIRKRTSTLARLLVIRPIMLSRTLFISTKRGLGGIFSSTANELYDDDQQESLRDFATKSEKSTSEFEDASSENENENAGPTSENDPSLPPRRPPDDENDDTNRPSISTRISGLPCNGGDNFPKKHESSASSSSSFTPMTFGS